MPTPTQQRRAPVLAVVSQFGLGRRSRGGRTAPPWCAGASWSRSRGRGRRSARCHSLAQPVQRWGQAIRGGGDDSKPLTPPRTVGAHGGCTRGAHLFHGHGMRKVGLVHQDGEWDVGEAVLGQQQAEAEHSVRQSVAVRGVDEKQGAGGAGEIVAPQRADLVAAANIPHRHSVAIVVDRLDVEPDRGYLSAATAVPQLCELAGTATPNNKRWPHPASVP